MPMKPSWSSTVSSARLASSHRPVASRPVLPGFAVAAAAASSNCRQSHASKSSIRAIRGSFRTGEARAVGSFCHMPRDRLARWQYRERGATRSAVGDRARESRRARRRGVRARRALAPDACRASSREHAQRAMAATVASTMQRRRRRAGRGRHRHGQDHRLPDPGDPQRQARAGLDRHEEPAGADRRQGPARF